MTGSRAQADINDAAVAGRDLRAAGDGGRGRVRALLDGGVLAQDRTMPAAHDLGTPHPRRPPAPRLGVDGVRAQRPQAQARACGCGCGSVGVCARVHVTPTSDARSFGLHSIDPRLPNNRPPSPPTHPQTNNEHLGLATEKGDGKKRPASVIPATAMGLISLFAFAFELRTTRARIAAPLPPMCAPR